MCIVKFSFYVWFDCTSVQHYEYLANRNNKLLHETTFEEKKKSEQITDCRGMGVEHGPSLKPLNFSTISLTCNIREDISIHRYIGDSITHLMGFSLAEIHLTAELHSVYTSAH